MVKSVWQGQNDSTAVQFVRYTIVGGLAFIVDFGSLYFLTDTFHIYYLLSAAVAFLLGLVTNYSLSLKWVFNRRTLENRYAEFGAFAGIGIVGLGMNEVILWTMTDLAMFHYLVSKLFSTAVVFFWNFGARKFLLFR